MVSSASDSLSDGLDDVGHRISRAGQRAKASASTAVLNHPLTAVGMAAGVGFVLGMIARRT